MSVWAYYCVGFSGGLAVGFGSLALLVPFHLIKSALRQIDA